jgi:hypothetical protein
VANLDKRLEVFKFKPILKKEKEKEKKPEVMTHTCNPNYTGGGDQEDHGLRSAPEKS